jgi:hypothetical protein
MSESSDLRSYVVQSGSRNRLRKFTGVNMEECPELQFLRSGLVALTNKRQREEQEDVNIAWIKNREWAREFRKRNKLTAKEFLKILGFEEPSGFLLKLLVTSNNKYLPSSNPESMSFQLRRALHELKEKENCEEATRLEMSKYQDGTLLTRIRALATEYSILGQHEVGFEFYIVNVFIDQPTTVSIEVAIWIDKTAEDANSVAIAFGNFIKDALGMMMTVEVRSFHKIRY